MKRKSNTILFIGLFLLLQVIAQSKRDSSYLIHQFSTKANNTYVVDSSYSLIKTKLKNGTVVQAIVIDGDTNYVFNMNAFEVVDLRPYNDKEKDKKFRRLKYHVKKVYPYARLASERLNKYSLELVNIKSKRKRRQLIKMKEKELKEEFTDIIKKMSVTSGRVLVKLIDRETGESTYKIIKEMRGGFKAFVYQGIGKLYGADLKLRYDPTKNEEDEMIERIVQLILSKRNNSFRQLSNN